MADDNIYDSEDDEEYKPDLEKPSKKSRGRKENERSDGFISRPSAMAGLEQSNGGAVEDPLGQMRSDAKKAKINAIWEMMNAKGGVSSSTTARSNAASSPAQPSRATASAATPGWMRNLGMVPKKTVTEPTSSPSENGSREAASAVDLTADADDDDAAKAKKENARKVASAALAAAKSAGKASTDGKIEISEVRDFAGEDIRVTKYVEANSKAATLARRKAETVASSGLDALLDQIGKKQKLNILDKSRKDWGEFKEDTGIEEELEGHIKSGDKYTEKVAFLQRSDYREYEKERDARLALLSKRRTESAPAD